MKLQEKLVQIQSKLKVPKKNYNRFGKFNYRSAEDILEAVKPLNAEHGVLLTLTDKPVLIGDWHYIEATAKITDGEEEMTVVAYARESLSKSGMDASQITGTASTYARKYALNGLYLIDDTKDADTDAAKELEGSVKPPTKAQLDFLNKEAQEVAKMYKSNLEAVKHRAGIHESMSADDAGTAMHILKEAREKFEKENGESK